MKIHVSDKIIAQYNEGDPAAFQIIFDEAYEAVYQMALKYVRQPDQADDLAEETFIKCWNQRGRIPDNRRLTGFIYQVTHNACINYLKQQQARQSHAARVGEDFMASMAPTEEAEQDWLQQQMLQRLSSAINSLPRSLKLIVQFAFLEELPNGIIQALLRKKKKTIRNQKAEALKRLRKALRDFCREP